MAAWRFVTEDDLKNGTCGRMTDEEAACALAAVEAARRLREEILAARGGIPFPSSAELINEMREERAAQIDATLRACDGGDNEWS